MARSLLERRLREVTDRLDAARRELRILDEQLEALSDSADDARIRSLVSETPLADREYEEAQRHADAMARSRASMLQSIADLEKSQAELLERLVNDD